MACNRSSAGIDGESSLAVVLYRPGLAVNSHNNGDSTRAATNGIFPFNRLPVELQDKIIGFAMSATDHEISLPCLINAAYKPNIAVGLLLVNHRIYHESHFQLRKRNIFVFRNFGCDLKTIASSIGPLKCRSGACGHRPLHSILTNVVFDLGDEELPNCAYDRVDAFGCALRNLRSPITVNSLHLRLAYYTFANSTQLSDLASALSKIKVQEKLIITGDEGVLDMSFGELPSKLGMGTMPVYSRFEAYHPEIQYSPGSFFHQYIPEKQVGEDTESEVKHLAAILTPLSEAEKTAGGNSAG